MERVTYYEPDHCCTRHTSRTLSGDHEDRVTDTGGVLVVRLEDKEAFEL